MRQYGGFSLTKRDLSASSGEGEAEGGEGGREEVFVYTIMVMEPTEYCLKTRDW